MECIEDIKPKGGRRPPVHFENHFEPCICNLTARRCIRCIPRPLADRPHGFAARDHGPTCAAGRMAPADEEKGLNTCLTELPIRCE